MLHTRHCPLAYQAPTVAVLARLTAVTTQEVQIAQTVPTPRIAQTALIPPTMGRTVLIPRTRAAAPRAVA